MSLNVRPDELRDWFGWYTQEHTTGQWCDAKERDMDNVEELRRREEDPEGDREDHEESQSHGLLGKLGSLLTIFGAVFSVTTFVIPVEGLTQRLALSAFVASVSWMIYRGLVALLDKKLDWVFAVLVLITFGLGIWCAVLLVEDRGSPSLGIEPALPEFDLSSVNSYSNGAVELILGDDHGLELDSSSWSRALYSEYSDISFSNAGIFGQDGTQFALLGVGSDTSFATCRDQASWVAVLGWDQIKRGSFACVKNSSDGRRGILRIDQMPNLDSREPTVQVTGMIWEPVVDR